MHTSLTDRALRSGIALLSAICALALSQPALAQTQQPTNIQVEQFEPLPTQGLNLLNNASSDGLGHMKFSFGLFYHFVKDPLQLVDRNDPDTVVSRVIANQHKAELSGAIGLFDRVEIGVVVPLVAYQSGDDLAALGRPGEALDGFSLLDPRIIPKVTILKHQDFGGFGLALMVPVYLPFGDDGSFNSDGKLRVEPRLIADWRHDSGFKVIGNVGYQVRPEVTSQNIVSDDALRWSLGLQIPTGVEKFHVIGSVFGSATFNDGRDGFAENANDPIEALGGLQFANLPANLVAQVGAGAGLTSDIGAPALRVFASLSYTPMGPFDRDEDGILDDKDQCPNDPEDKDGFKDDDGCPEYDNDGDGILDNEDKCPLEPEDKDGFQDKDGCPDPDNDGDGIKDVDDKCPDVAGVPEEKGCPIQDKDKDGIPDNKDLCPDKPEDKDGFQDDDGCPDLDNDGDGIPDTADKCPLKAEDKDGFEDEDGCPDLDNDKDGIPDAKDKCPNKAETYNGVKDDDGCPEKTKSLIQVDSLGITAQVNFKSGKSTIQKSSYKTLNLVANYLKKHKEVTGVRVEGHTDDVGKDADNLRLSKDRAKAVKEYLTAQSIDAKILDSEGFGETMPLCKDIPELSEQFKKAKSRARRKLKKEMDACRAKNRRVQFKFTEINGKKVEATDQLEIKKEKKVLETVAP